MSKSNDVSLNGTEYKRGWIRAYEQADSALWQADPIEYIDDVVETLRREGATLVLEPGCGDGRNTRRLVAEGFSVVGLDLCDLALQRIADDASASWKAMPTLIAGDIEGLPAPFPEQMFDAVLCFDSFGQLAFPTRAAESFFRLLKPGGLFIGNLYTPRDVAFGEGREIGTRRFIYEDTLFCFFELEDVPELFADYDIESAMESIWIDPPHPGYRDYQHQHSNIVVTARKPVTSTSSRGR